MRLGRLLLIWRLRGGLTLKAAAGRIGINPSTLRRIEQGESMHGDTLTTLLVWLMGREEPSGNETFIFEAEEAVAGEDQVAERNATPAGGLCWKSVDCGESLEGETRQIVYQEEVEPWSPGAAIKDKSEAPEKHSVHAVD